MKDCYAREIVCESGVVYETSIIYNVLGRLRFLERGGSNLGRAHSMRAQFRWWVQQRMCDYIQRLYRSFQQDLF